MESASRRFSLAEQLRNELALEHNPKNDTSLFAEEPVALSTFIKDKKFLDQPNLDLGLYQYDLVRHMEQIYLPTTYPYMVENFGSYWSPVRYVNLMNVQWGKGGGKDLSVQIAVSRISYLLLCLADPAEYYDLAAQSDIHILNIAMNAPQAHRAFFRPLSTAIKRSPWFKDKLRSEITDQAKAIRLDKQVELISGHSQVENFEGLSPIAVVLDEISGFQSDEQKAQRGIVESQTTAEAVYDIARTSAATRFPECYKVAAISYPRYLHDPIQKLCAKAEADIEELGIENSRHYVDGPRTTWDVNPRYKKYPLVTIPETNVPVPTVLVADYRDDAVMARSKYECRPERAANRYMRNDSALSTAFPRKSEEWVEPIQIYYYWGVDQDGARAEDSAELATVPGWQVGYHFSPELVPMEGAVYGIHVDLALTHDRAGISMCHVKNWERREHLRGEGPGGQNPDFQQDDRPVVKMDFATAYEADLQARDNDGKMQPREIQLRWARNLVRELRRRGFTIGLVTFDTYQAQDSIQILETWGIESDNLSMDRNVKPYANLRELIYDSRLEGYYNQLLLEELEGLNLLPNGKIDHPPGGSKDIADALCGAAYNAIVLGGDEGEDPIPVDVNMGLMYEVDTGMGSPGFWGNLNVDFGVKAFKF